MKTKHANLPLTFILNKRSAFVSHVIKEKANVLGTIPNHATTKYAQTIGMLERSQALIKQTLKNETGNPRLLWHKYVSIAVSNYKTSYHASFGCAPNRMFHGRIPCNVFGSKLGIRPGQATIPVSQTTHGFHKQTEMIYQYIRKIPQKLLKNTKPTTARTPTFQSLDKQVKFMSHSRKQIIQEIKLFLRSSAGLGLSKLKKFKRPYQATFILYANLGSTECNSMIACDYINSHPHNSHPMYKSHHENRNATQK